MYKKNGKLDTFKLERWYRKMDQELEELERSDLPYNKEDIEIVRLEMGYEIRNIKAYLEETDPEFKKLRHESLEVWYKIFKDAIEEEIKKQLTQPAKVK